MSAETPGTDRDTEVLAIILDKCSLSGQECHNPLPRYSELTDDRNTHWHRRAAEDGEPMVQLAAYVARKVEPIEQENRWNELACEGNQRLFAETLERAERAERERDEARAVIERVLADSMEHEAPRRPQADEPWCKGSMRDPLYSTDVNGKPWGKCRSCERYVPMAPHLPITKMHRDQLRATFAPATEPASDRPLTVDEHLAEVERRIEARLGVTSRTLRDVRAYREEVRRG